LTAVPHAGENITPVAGYWSFFDQPDAFSALKMTCLADPDPALAGTALNRRAILT
jgi:hypothetical protein